MNLTEAAEQKVKDLVKGEPGAVALRIGIVGGGCSGFNYAFTFAEEIQEGDIMVNDSGAVVVVDPLSYQYLQGAKIDYKKSIQGEQFTIDNPNATTTCGCGTSFSV